ncbi:hypothetical protein ACFX1Z_018371 [Malus domestica]
MDFYASVAEYFWVNEHDARNRGVENNPNKKQQNLPFDVSDEETNLLTFQDNILVSERGCKIQTRHCCGDFSFYELPQIERNASATPEMA